MPLGTTILVDHEAYPYTDPATFAMLVDQTSWTPGNIPARGKILVEYVLGDPLGSAGALELISGPTVPWDVSPWGGEVGYPASAYTSGQQITIIPEPAMLSLLVVGGLLMGRRARSTTA